MAKIKRRWPTAKSHANIRQEEPRFYKFCANEGLGSFWIVYSLFMTERGWFFLVFNLQVAKGLLIWFSSVQLVSSRILGYYLFVITS